MRTAKNNLTNFVTIPLSKLKKCPWNYKSDLYEIEEKLLENIRRNGVIENLVVREIDEGTYEVVNGNHRLSVLSRLGIKEAVCFNLGKISDAQAKRIAVELNETRFPNDSIKFAEVIRDINVDFDTDDMVKSIPYNKEEIEFFISSLNIDFTEKIAENSQDGLEHKALKEAVANLKCPRCGYEFPLK